MSISVWCHSLVSLLHCYVCFCFYYVVPLPVFTKHPNDQIVELYANNFNISLCCNATSDDISYSITKDGEIFAANNYINSDGSFCSTIPNVKPDDRGHYQCVVENEGGKVYSKIANVFIFGMCIHVIL